MTPRSIRTPPASPYNEVHHENPLSEGAKAEWTEEVWTSLSQVAVLCANCHWMVYWKKLTI